MRYKPTDTGVRNRLPYFPVRLMFQTPQPHATEARHSPEGSLGGFTNTQLRQFTKSHIRGHISYALGGLDLPSPSVIYMLAAWASPRAG